MLILLLASLALVGGIAGQRGTNQEQCVDESDALYSVYHAPPRAVPFPRVDAAIKRGFLLLLHRDAFPDHQHNSPYEPVTAETCEPSVIDPAIIAQINELCPRGSFFYSFAPRHVSATMLLQQQFGNQTTAADVLRVAGAILRRHEVNPRVWYYALLSTLFNRQDLNGYYIAYAIDSTPDLYLTNTVINLATRGSPRPRPEQTTRECTTAIGAQVTDVRIEHPEANQTQMQQQQQQANMCRNQTGTGGTTRAPNQNQQASNQNQRLPNQNQRSQQQQQSLNNLNNFGLPGNTFGLPANTFGLPTSTSGVQAQQQSSNNLNNNFGLPANTFGLPTNDDRQSTVLYYPGFTSSGAPTDSNFGFSGQRQKRQTRRQCVPYNGTRGATGGENRLWYFREDLMVNQHHWYWHQYYPQMAVRHPERRGEQFYFTHHNIIARYNAERLSNGLPVEQPLDLQFGGNIGPGYNSDLVDKTSGRYWTARLPNSPLSDVVHGVDPDFRLNVTMANITQLYANLTNHIAQGFLLANRSNNVFQLDIRNMEGLSHLGNTIEASEQLSTHPQFYNDVGVHNLGHIALGLATDPDYRCQLPTGVMADLTVTMRDPSFYKLHTLVDEMFSRYKSTLPTYQVNSGEWPLQWPGVKVRNVEVLAGNGQKSNHLNTFWSVKRFPLEEGIDGSIHDGDVEVDICAQHLNHEPFRFRLTVDIDSCARTVSTRGMVRIFMAPRYNLDGRRFSMDETRRLMFQLDAFPVDLRLGRNVITRNSQDSSSTKPWTRSLQDMLRDPDNGGQTEYCGCGWPDHLYIPKGSPQGMEFDLFAIVTNFDQDQVIDTAADQNIQQPCNSPYLFCGVPYRRYPDARPMGYPFDRQPYQVQERGQVRLVKDLEEYVAHVSNAKSSVVVVQHADTFA